MGCTESSVKGMQCLFNTTTTDWSHDMERWDSIIYQLVPKNWNHSPWMSSYLQCIYQHGFGTSAFIARENTHPLSPCSPSLWNAEIQRIRDTSLIESCSWYVEQGSMPFTNLSYTCLIFGGSHEKEEQSLGGRRESLTVVIEDSPRWRSWSMSLGMSSRGERS